MSLEEALRGLSGFGAQWILWLLVALSVAALAIVFERTLYMLSTREDHTALLSDLRVLLERGAVDKARQRAAECVSFEAQVALAGLRAVGAREASERMAGESERARLAMERRLAFLGTLGNNAPFIGLLGTVIGIIGAFRELDASNGQLTTGLMAEVGEALLATAVGLLVALPAVFCFNLFQRLIRVRLARANALGNEVLAFFHQQAKSEEV